MRATGDTSADHLPTSSAERHRPNPIPNLDHANHDPNHHPNHDHDHVPSHLDLGLHLGLDRLRPVCWL